MSRTIPVSLQANLDATVQTVTRCLRIELEDGRVFGLTMLDSPVIYDHGDEYGEIEYSATNGFDPKTFSADASYQVANSEAPALVAAEGEGITVAMIERGELDNSTWTCFLVNYANPITASALILDAGDIGEIPLMDNLVYVPQLNSYSMRLSQSVGTVWQRPCRAIFGTPRESPTGCGVDAEALWEDGEVITVGTEADRVFTGDIPGFFPGRLEWLTGQNAGLYLATESSSGETIVLAETTRYPIAEGDTYRHRPDCTKRKEGPLGCLYYDNYLNYNGEDNTPVGDAASGSMPGAGLPGGGGYVGEVPDSEEA